MKFFYFLLSFHFVLAHAEVPVDISYMVADFKYSQEHGLKICEVQHGALSAVNGDLYIWGGDGSISPKIATFFDQFPVKKWVTSMSYPPLKNSLLAKGWEPQQSIKKLFMNPAFLECALSPPEDPTSISSYTGIVYATRDIVKDFDLYHNLYPAILFIDAATLPYWIDKYKMSVLFEEDPELKGYKADFRLYPKKYDPFLAEKIQQEMPGEFYVIKPRGEFLGTGVIVVEAKDLDHVLQGLENDSYWSRNQDDTLLIEKYYMSDLFEEGALHYDATMRIAFILVYDQGKMTYHYLGSFWKLPCKALEEEGTLNEKRISFGAPPFYRAVDPELLEEVNQKLERAMLLLYNVMLSNTKAIR